jgi:hypothetical protein
MIDKLTTALETPQATAQDAVTNAMAVYSEASAFIDGYKIIQEWAKRIIEESIIETGQSAWESDFAKCYVTKPSLTVSYDSKALDILVASNTALARLIAPYRRETERAGSLTIRRK